MHLIYTFEEHGEVLAYWQAKNYFNETIVYIDQHFDFKSIHKALSKKTQLWKESNKNLSELNRFIPFQENEEYCYGLDSFLNTAAYLGYIKRLIWILPDPTYLSINHLAKHVLNIIAILPNYADQILLSFKLNPYSITFCLDTLEVEVTTIDRLPFIQNTQNARVDIDLDYFYNAHDKQLVCVDKFLKILKECNLLSNIETITYSISSGFLPPHRRTLAIDIAKHVQASLLPSSRKLHQAQQSVHVLSKRTPITANMLCTLFDKELYAMGGAGYALYGALALQIPDIGTAIDSYYTAVKLNDRASMTAYNIGQYFLVKKDYQNASKWFALATSDTTDSIHMHSLCLQALCLARQQNWTAAYHASLKAIALVPLKKISYQIAELSSKMLKADRDQLLQKKNKFSSILNLMEM